MGNGAAKKKDRPDLEVVKPTGGGAQAEAESLDNVIVHYGENDYIFPGSLDEADGDVLDAIDDQKASYAIRGLLGPEQWRRFKATKPKVRDYNDLFAAYAKRIGLPIAGE